MPESASPELTADDWSQVAEAYDGVIAPYLEEFAVDALVLTALGGGERIIDVAAGTGALSLPAARRGAGVLAIDFSPAMLDCLRRRARAEGLELDTTVMDGQDLRVPEAAFDAAYSNLGVTFFPDRVAGLCGMHRALRAGGRCAITSWAAPEKVEWHQAMAAAIGRAVPDLPADPRPPAMFSQSDPRELEREMRAAGFRNVRVETVAHVWRLASPESAWTSMATTNPVVPRMLARLGPGLVARVRGEALREFRRRQSAEGEIAYRAEANVGLGEA